MLQFLNLLFSCPTAAYKNVCCNIDISTTCGFVFVLSLYLLSFGFSHTVYISRLQYAKSNLHNTNLPAIKIDKDSEITEEILLAVLRRALVPYSSLQGPDGHWPGGYSGILFILPLMVWL